MELTYNKAGSLTKISLSNINAIKYNKDTISNLRIDWSYLEQNYTVFQVKVWKELVKIPFGETRTYSQIATSIGKPTACRAVANACGKNPLAILIPCHRVTGTNDLGGYFWGIEIKKHLLDQEKLKN